jgi:hypothetical protein
VTGTPANALPPTIEPSSALHDPPLDVVARRVTIFERTGDPEVLWPGVRETERAGAARELERVVRAMLAGEHGVAVDAASAHAPRALSIAAHTTGVGPLLGRWVEDDRIAASGEIRSHLARHLCHARGRAERLERILPAVIDALEAAGAAPVLLKGAHTARVYFEEPAARRMADVDLLVAPDEVDAAEQTLRRLGYVPVGRAHRPYKRDWVAAGAGPKVHSTERTDERDRWSIELHASLDRVFHPGAVARLDRERHRADVMELYGRRVRVLSPEILLLMLACHCSQELDGGRLLKLIEIVRVARTLGEPDTPRWRTMAELVDGTEAARYAYPAFALAEDLAPGTIARDVLDAGHAASTWAARHTVRRLVPAGGSLDRRGALRQAMWTRGPVAFAQRALRALWPASFVETSGVAAGWGARLRRWRAGALSWRAPDERRPDRR